MDKKKYLDQQVQSNRVLVGITEYLNHAAQELLRIGFD